jgi:hypothetical protein
LTREINLFDVMHFAQCKEFGKVPPIEKVLTVTVRLVKVLGDILAQTKEALHVTCAEHIDVGKARCFPLPVFVK